MNRPSIAKAHLPSSVAKKFDAVPLLDLHRQYKTIREEVLAAIERVCSSQQFILGAEVETLESEISTFTGATEAVGCASGTDALWLALLAVGVKPGDVVITTAFSFFASVNAIVRTGARPLLVDIDPYTLNIDPPQLEAKLGSAPPRRLRALLPVHLYGQCADMDALQHLADEFHLPIIEDAAQAIGATWRNRRVGSLGTTAAFSFYPTKNLSAYGDAGLATTGNPELAEHMRRLRNHGASRRYYHDEFGWNCRMDAIQAAVLRLKLAYLEKWNEQRRGRAATYHRLFEGAGLSAAYAGSPLTRGTSSPAKTGLPVRDTPSTSPASSVLPVRLPQSSPHAYHIFHQYVIRAERRDELRKSLIGRKIGTEIYYPVPLHLQPCFAYLGYSEGDLPESERAAREVLALPMFPELTEDEQKWVVESIAEFYS